MGTTRAEAEGLGEVMKMFPYHFSLIIWESHLSPRPRDMERAAETENYST